ncbi:MAG: hypothetical protein ACLGH7_01690, partial [Actinomycetes bacterium]
MGISGGVGVDTEGVHATVAACVAGLDALDREDAALEGRALEGRALGGTFLVPAAAGAGAGAAGVYGAGVDVLQRRYEIRLERLELTAQLEARLAARKAQDAAEALGFQDAMTAPDATGQDRVYARMSTVEEIAGVLGISSA